MSDTEREARADVLADYRHASLTSHPQVSRVAIFQELHKAYAVAFTWSHAMGFRPSPSTLPKFVIVDALLSRWSRRVVRRCAA